MDGLTHPLIKMGGRIYKTIFIEILPAVGVGRRWSMLPMFFDHIQTSQDLEKAILLYNTSYVKLWKFTLLHAYFKHMAPRTREVFFR